MRQAFDNLMELCTNTLVLAFVSYSKPFKVPWMPMVLDWELFGEWT